MEHGKLGNLQMFLIILFVWNMKPHNNQEYILKQTQADIDLCAIYNVTNTCQVLLTTCNQAIPKFLTSSDPNSRESHNRKQRVQMLYIALR